MRFIAVIPARYGSSRFPGKPLADIQGKPMIQWVYEHTNKVLREVFVATDDDRIFQAIKQFGGQVVLTSDQHQSGTDRCHEAIEIIEAQQQQTYDVVINVQGDEPFIKPEQIQSLMDCFTKAPETSIATLIKRIEHNTTLFDPNRPKVVLNKNHEAVYFSRSPIPYIRGYEKEMWINQGIFYQHIGMYAYRTDVLKAITKLPASSLELAESLEQLRWVENGYRIKTAITDYESKTVDTVEDLNKIRMEFKNDNPQF